MIINVVAVAAIVLIVLITLWHARHSARQARDRKLSDLVGSDDANLTALSDVTRERTPTCEELASRDFILWEIDVQRDKARKAAGR